MCCRKLIKIDPVMIRIGDALLVLWSLQIMQVYRLVICCSMKWAEKYTGRDELDTAQDLPLQCDFWAVYVGLVGALYLQRKEREKSVEVKENKIGKA
ncbi:hypothetical protein JHK85_013281 [Glycine max]|nr:hypothetical protein JHK85_013281 [Glycine max]